MVLVTKCNLVALRNQVPNHLAGFGPFSLDALLGIATIWTPRVVAVVLSIGVAGGLATLVIRRSPAAAGGASQ
jgi:hypothetical protein